MGAAARLFDPRDKARQTRVGGQATIRDGAVDPRQILHHHPAGPDVHMADL